MNGLKNATRNNLLREIGTSARGRYGRVLALSLGSAAVFAVLFYLWGQELFPSAAGGGEGPSPSSARLP